MRIKLSLLVAGALAAAGAAVSLSAPVANATTCPPGTIEKKIKIPVTGEMRTICVPGQQCDPGPCDPTAAPPRD